MAGIYIHIPFCKTRCIYCDFYSTTRSELKQQYIRALCTELKTRKGYLKEEPIETIYFGGGTPSQLAHEDFEQIFRTIKEVYGTEHAEEITLEANPDDLTEEYVSMLRTLPFNRISMGIQTFDAPTLKLLNRRHNAAQAIAAIHRLRQAGFRNISIDLIYGLPDETDQRWERDLQQAVGLDVEHISAYHLTYEKAPASTKCCRAIVSAKWMKRVACASSRRSWTPWEPRGMSITKYPTSASPACTHATTLLTGKAFRIWAAALQPTPSMRRQGNGTQLLWKDT